MHLVGGATSSIFPRAEAMLLHSPDFQNALEYVAARKKMERYTSVMDFLFCEIYSDWSRACFLYYDHKGPTLRDVIPTDQIEKFDRRLVIALQVAYQHLTEQRRVSWSWYCVQVKEAIQKAA